MIRAVRLIVSVGLAICLSGCIFYERPHHRHPPPPPRAYPYRGY